jgi:uncharacterized protein (TIGR02145 family)
MKTNTKFSIIILLTALSVSFGVRAQITIGSGLDPVEGSLLDLKEKTPNNPAVDNTTATKGMQLPRVVLSKRDNLYPMFTDDGSGGYIGATKSDEDLAHTGLTVFNLTEDEPEGLCPGVHVWSGSAWIRLDADVAEAKKPDITVTDVDGNKYTARWFGKISCGKYRKGAYWFLSNLLVTRLPDGSPLPPNPTGGDGRNYALSGTGSSTTSSMARIYSSSDLSTGTVSYGEDDAAMSAPNITVSRLEYARRFGLYYQPYHANMVCPTGWTLPSMQDWEELVDNLGGVADATPLMRANNKYYWDESYGATQWGSYDPPVSGRSGFDIYPLGAANTGERTYTYSTGIKIWSSDGNKAFRMHNGYPGIDLITGSSWAFDFLPVRCIKK